MMESLHHQFKALFLRKLGFTLQPYTISWKSAPEGLSRMMMELDATNDVKFNRHIIVALDSECLFRNVHHVSQ